MPLDRTWIASRIPHKDRMCLLDAVLEWDATRVACRATSHRDVDNPLRAHGRLGVACGIEYAAQAMAIHGALLLVDATPPEAGYLTSVRDLAFHASRLDDLAVDLEIEALRHFGDGNNAIYHFTVRANQRDLLRGRATVMLDTGRSAPVVAEGS